MADPREFAVNAGELKATVRYFDQIQRASDRLGRTRYQNVVKLNNELKFTSRYFDQIYRTALKLSRLKLMPQVTLNDKASKDIDRLLAKLAQIRSKRIQVAADVIMPAQPAAPKIRPQNPNKVLPKIEPAPVPRLDTKVPASPAQQQQSMNITITNPAGEMPQIDFGSLEAAITSNTDAVMQLTGKLENLKLGAAGGGKKEEKGFISTILDGAKTAKSFNDGHLNLRKAKAKNVEIAGHDEARRQTIRDRAAADAAAPTRPLEESIALSRKRNIEDKEYEAKRNVMVSERRSHRIDATINGIEGVISGTDVVKNLYGAIAGKKESDTPPLEAASQLVQNTVNSGVLDTVAKGAARRIMGPVATVLEVGDAIRSTDNKERFETLGAATGSAIGGSAGAAIGSAIMPVIGTAVGGYLGSVAGDFVGGKVGGFLYDKGGKAAQYVDEKLDQLSNKLNDFFSWGKHKDKDDKKAETKSPPPPPSVPTIMDTINGTSTTKSVVYDPSAVKHGDLLDPLGKFDEFKARQQTNVAPRPQESKPAGSQISIEMSQSQLSTVTSTIQSAKPEVTNQISINIGPGTVQLDIHEEIDYAEIEGKIGAAIVEKVRQAFNNYKPAGGGSGGPSKAMAT
ncbi:hypothetical protein B9G55_18820 [Saccharibacillus sp. O16]|nr:hypothetical protein B9G55_18820 [Saccharibacillus sp. O16]